MLKRASGAMDKLFLWQFKTVERSRYKPDFAKYENSTNLTNIRASEEKLQLKALMS